MVVGAAGAQSVAVPTSVLASSALDPSNLGKSSSSSSSSSSNPKSARADGAISSSVDKSSAVWFTGALLDDSSFNGSGTTTS
jgi:hypothetical protein